MFPILALLYTVFLTDINVASDLFFLAALVSEVFIPLSSLKIRVKICRTRLLPGLPLFVNSSNQEKTEFLMRLLKIY